MKEERSFKFLNIVSALILLIAFCFIILFSYLLFFHDNPPITINAPVTLDKDSYFAGETMQVTADICRHTTSGATLYPTFVNLDTHQLFDAVPIFVDNLPKGCAESTITVSIPHYLTPGMYVRIIRARYEVNFLTERVVELTTEEFEIKEREIINDK